MLFRLMIRASVAGASGYGGGELLRLLDAHPEVEVVTVTAGDSAGLPLADVWPQIRGRDERRLQAADPERLAEGTDVAFLALPAGLALKVVPALLERGVRVVDLGPDFRLRAPSTYRRWYGAEHTQPELLAEAVYGLPELDGGDRAGTRLVANPGCYATAALLALAPLVQAKVAESRVFVDGKSGISGAGRTASREGSFTEANEDVRPYGVAGHRHTPEMEQGLGRVGPATRVCFTPHVVPMTRGLLATCSVPLRRDLDDREALQLYQDSYEAAPFVRVSEALPRTKATTGSNFCDLSVRVDAERETAVILAALDNLGKGAAGQAVQNMNRMFGRDETEGLWCTPIYP